MNKVTCSLCERTLQDGEDNRDIGDYTLCSKCYKRMEVIMKHFIDKYPLPVIKSTATKMKTKSK